MPTCPGCNDQVPHLQLPVHERFCEAVTGHAPCEQTVIEYFDQRLAGVERRLDGRISMLETGLDSTVSRRKLFSPPEQS